jgi:hypothetical protein
MSLHCPVFSDGVGGVILISIPVRLSTCFEEALSWSRKWSRDRRKHLQGVSKETYMHYVGFKIVNCFYLICMVSRLLQVS